MKRHNVLRLVDRKPEGNAWDFEIPLRTLPAMGLCASGRYAAAG
jgi:hypothetical protein